MAAQYNQTVSYVNSLGHRASRKVKMKLAPSQESDLLGGSKRAGVNDTRWAEAALHGAGTEGAVRQLVTRAISQCGP